MGLDVDVLTIRIFPALDLNQVKKTDNEEEQEELQGNHILRETYNSELVDDVDGADATSDHEQDEEDHSEDNH